MPILGYFAVVAPVLLGLLCLAETVMGPPGAMPLTTSATGLPVAYVAPRTTPVLTVREGLVAEIPKGQDTGKDGKLVWILFIPMAVSGLVTFLTAMTFGAVVMFLVLLPFMTLISLISLIAAIYMIYLCIQPGTLGENPFGPVPPVVTGKPAAS